MKKWLKTILVAALALGILASANSVSAGDGNVDVTGPYAHSYSVKK